MHVQVKEEKKNELEEMMESYVMQCENAMSTGEREDFSKIVQRNLDEQKSEKQDEALAKSSNPAKTAAETAALTPTLMMLNVSTSTTAVANAAEKEPGGERAKRWKSNWMQRKY